MPINFRIVASVLALAGGSLVAPGSDESPEPTASATSGDAAYPVAAGHQLGTATLEKAPERDVALSGAGLDALLLGIQVAKHNPDLVLAGGDSFIDSEYEALFPLVPRAACETGLFEDPRQTTLRQVAKLVGGGEHIVKDVEAKVYVALELVEVTSLRNLSLLSMPYSIGNWLPRVATSVAS